MNVSSIQDEQQARAIIAAQAIAEAPDRAEDATRLPWSDVWEPPGPIADAFYWSDADIVGIRGPVGSGKTTSHLRSRFRRARMMPISTIDGIRRYKVVIARQTYRQLWSTTIPSWWEVMPKKIGKWSGGRGDPVTHLIEYEDEFGPIEFTAEFMAFGESTAEIEANIRGVQTTDLALEEADTVDVSVVTKGVGRIDRFPKPVHFQASETMDAYPPELQSYGQISCSYNSPDEENWTVRVIEGGADPDDAEAREIVDLLTEQGIDIQFFRQPGFDEPGCENLKNLSPKYYPRQIAAMRAEGRGNDVDRLVYNRIGYIRSGDPVLNPPRGAKIYQRNRHVAAMPLKPISGLGLRIGLDQGYFGAAVIGQFTRPFGWRIYAELCFKDGCFAPEFGQALKDLVKERFPGFHIEGAWCDIAGNQKESEEDVTWMNQVSLHSGIEIEPQPLGGNRIEPRLAVWRAAMQYEQFGQQGLLVDRSCKVLIRGLENDYVWEQDADKAGNRTRKPKKRGVRAADVIDAGGYMMLSESAPDGTPKTASMLGHNGGPGLNDDGFYPESSEPEADSYDFNPLEMM